MNNKPKILLYDIETGYNVVNVFSLITAGKYIPYYSIQQERYIICATVKELGKTGFKSWSVLQKNDDPRDDKWVVEELWKELSTADAIIAHNGDNFDLKFLNTRAVYHGLGPLPNLISIDTLKIARKNFNFNSNRLDYLAKFLGVGEKIETTESLWVDAQAGKKSAVRKMVKYNQRDVEILEKVYLKLAPYETAQLNQASMSESDDPICPLCGSENLHSRGNRFTRTGVYQRFHCQDCGHWSQGTRTIRNSTIKSK